MVSKTVNTLSKLDMLYQNSMVKAKQYLLNAIYGDKLCYDDQGLRTGLIKRLRI
ncbi:MAG: hypothetical protein JWQ34_1107 [Mucilaginibacter sp.]|nr:hypothetical protein [Mucilaginibacter sp.]